MPDARDRALAHPAALGTPRHDRAPADGVCANVEFPFPGRLIVGARWRPRPGSIPTQDPWLPERSVWPLLEVVDECLGEPWLAHARARTSRARVATRGSAAPVRRGSPHRRPVRPLRACTARRWSAAWVARSTTAPAAAGRPSCGGGCARGSASRARPSGSRRRLRRGSRAEPGSARPPGALSLFGLTRLPAAHLEVLARDRRGRDVHLFAPAPLAGAVGAVVEALAGAAPRSRTRRDDRTASLPTNRLLASWGRDVARAAARARGRRRDRRAPSPPLPPSRERTTLLGALQADVRADRAPAGAATAGRARPRARS